MDFDALHDPNPPSVGGRELAAVAGRSRTLRRRRRVLTGTASVVALAAALGLVVVNRPDPTPMLQPDTTFDTPTSAVPSSEPPSTSTGSSTACGWIPEAPPWMPDGSTPGEPVRHVIDVGSSPYALTWTDTTGDVTLWTEPSLVGSEGSGEWIPVVAGGVVTGAYADPSLLSARTRTTVTGVQVEVERLGSECRRLYEFGGSEGAAGTTLTIDTLGPLVADWLDAWNLFAAATITRTSEASGDAMCFFFPGVSQDAPCVPFTAPATGSAVDPVVVELRDEPISDMPVRLVAGLTTDERFAPSTPFPLGGIDELAQGDPRRFVWGLVSPRMCESGVTSSDLFLATICAPDTVQPDPSTSTTVLDAVPDRVGMVVGIDTNGDAVLIRPGADPVVLFDGPEPGSVAVEGDLDFVDHVALSPDGRRAVVSSCCEPGSGSFVVVDTATLEVVGSGLGHLAEYTSYGDLVVASMDGISLIDGETLAWITDVVSVSMTPTSWFTDLAVIGVAVYALGVDTMPGSTGGYPVTLHRYVMGGDMHLSVALGSLPKSTLPEAVWGTSPRLTGITNVLFVVDSTGALRAFRPDTLDEVVATGQFGVTPLWVGNQVFTVTSGADGTVLGFEDTFQNFPDLHLTFARS